MARKAPKSCHNSMQKFLICHFTRGGSLIVLYYVPHYYILCFQVVGVTVREPQALTQLRREVASMKEELQSISITVSKPIRRYDLILL